VMNLGPAIVRREVALSAALPQPRYVKLNTDAILRMDPSTVTENLAAQITARLRTVDEGREVLNLPPLTDAQYAEFDRLTVVLVTVSWCVMVAGSMTALLYPMWNDIGDDG